MRSRDEQADRQLDRSSFAQHIRNFSIIAHIDHGKSTLADRLLEVTGTVAKRELREQPLDDMDLERERGITIKARAVAMHYRHQGETYELNLIDTPGHVDFQYEVSRSLACCEGALLLVDACQGVEAQTVANALAAMAQRPDHRAGAQQDRSASMPGPTTSCQEMETVLGIDPAEVLPASGKTGQGVEAVLAAIVERVPPPAGDPEAPLQAMVFDSHYDEFRGAITYVRVMNGTVRKGQKIRFIKTGYVHEVLELGQFVPQRRPCEAIAGRPGRLPDLQHQGAESRPHRRYRHHGGRADGRRRCPAIKSRSGWSSAACIPSDGQDFEELRDALTKLSRSTIPASSSSPKRAMRSASAFAAASWACCTWKSSSSGSSGEADLDLVQTAPNVTYEILTKTGEIAAHLQPAESARRRRDRGVPPADRAGRASCCPAKSSAPVMQLCNDRRGIYVRTEYLSPDPGHAGLRPAAGRSDLRHARQAEKLHARLRHDGLRAVRLSTRPTWCGMDILVGGKRVDALSIICDRKDADRRGRAIVKKLRGEIDRHMFEVAIQAAIGSRIIARETISAMRKNVTAKCYGGDITRKRKLWAKQREGKKRMKSVGSVDIPQKAFLAVLDTGGE